MFLTCSPVRVNADLLAQRFLPGVTAEIWAQNLVLDFVEDSAEARPAVLPLTKIVCSNYAFGAASKQNCLRLAYVMSPTNDDLLEFARIGGISLIASFTASLYDRTAFAAFFACAGGYALARAFNLARRSR
jgi:hypothetical protein